MFDPVTNAEIDAAFDKRNFGPVVRRPYLAKSVLKRALKFHCGSGIEAIMIELRLITPKLRTVTERGRQFCYQELDAGNDCG